MTPKYTAGQIEEALRQDPIADAEVITGRSWKEDESIGFLGMALQMRKSEALRRMLEATGDTTWSMPVDGYSAVLEQLGFREVYSEPFKGRYGDGCLYVHFRPGLLLRWDTYHGNCNASDVYYNWLPAAWPDRCRCTSGGRLEICDPDALRQYESLQARRRNCEYESAAWNEADKAMDAFMQQAGTAGHLVWCGSHDAREALRHNLDRLEANGQFAVPWKADPRPWLCHHGDHFGKCDHTDNLIQSRLAKLPPDVKACVGVSIKL